MTNKQYENGEHLNIHNATKEQLKLMVKDRDETIKRLQKRIEWKTGSVKWSDRNAKELYLKQKFQVENGGNIMKRDLVDELYKTAYKRYREKYPNKDFASIPNFLDSLWFSIEGELNRNGYNAAKKYVEEAELIILK